MRPELKIPLYILVIVLGGVMFMGDHPTLGIIQMLFGAAALGVYIKIMMVRR